MSEDTQRLSKLNQIYSDAETVDKPLFAEQRSNCLLYIGQHYSKQDSALNSFVRGQKAVPQEKKLRLTKNHIGAICDRLINSTVTSHSPSVSIGPRHKMEVQDKKAADIANGVWNRIKTFNKFDESVADYAFDFIVPGEVAAFVHFDPAKGEYLGMAKNINEMGEEIAQPSPKFSGEIVIKRLESFNLLREPQAKSWETSPYCIYREMVDVEVAKGLCGGDQEKIDKIEKSSEETFTVFDANKGQYGQSSKEKVLCKQIFYRPCHDYPEGYYVLYTTDTIIAEGSLNGIWPIAYRPYAKVTTSPRGFSQIKRLRPCQAEINRIASTIAMSQLYFRDRLMIQNGTKITNGGTMGGAQLMRYSGAMPQVQQGQTGENYLTVLDHQIDEMYKLSNLSAEEEEKVPNTDPMSLIYRSLKDKKKFSQKSDLFEGWISEVVQIALETAQKFVDDEYIVHAVDKKEQINIAEFKNITKLDYSIAIKPMSSDIESTLGEMQAIQHALQYGQNLPPEQLAILVANMPFLKDSLMTQELTADYRAVEDVFAAIERAQPISVMPSDNHKYFIKRISNRMKESSFRFLAPQIQQMYQQRLTQHEQAEADIAAKMQRAEQGMIPAGGALIPVSLYLDPNNASKRVRLPHDAVVWLYKSLNEQGSMAHDAQEQIGNESAMGDIAQMMGNSQPQQPQHPMMPQHSDHMTSSPQPWTGDQ